MFPDNDLQDYNSIRINNSIKVFDINSLIHDLKLNVCLTISK